MFVQIQADVIPEDKVKLLNECKMQEKATDEDVHMFLGQKRPQSKSGKCLIACIYEKTGGVCEIHQSIMIELYNFNI